MNEKLLKETESIIAEITQAIKVLEVKLSKSPAGSFEVIREKKSLRYYRLTKDGSHWSEEYLGKQDRQTIRQLEEKYYYTKLLKAMEKELKGLRRIEKILKSLPDSATVFLGIPKEKRHLITPFDIDAAVVNPILSKKPQKRIYKKIDTSFITQAGEKVRSKSELIIANKLEAAGIPYLYEYPLTMVDEEIGIPYSWHPDFRVLNKRTGKQYFWEHFGMLDNPDYCNTCLGKLEKYAENGYYAGKNLIITSESSLHPLSTQHIDCIIQYYLC